MPRKARSTLYRMHNLLSGDATIQLDAPEAWHTIGQLSMRVTLPIREGVYRAIRQADLIALVEAHPSYERYLWGWLRRARGDRP